MRNNKHKLLPYQVIEKAALCPKRAYNYFLMRPLNWRSPKHVLFSFPNL